MFGSLGTSLVLYYAFMYFIHKIEWERVWFFTVSLSTLLMKYRREHVRLKQKIFKYFIDKVEWERLFFFFLSFL